MAVRDLGDILLPAILAVLAWAAPQPQHSAGLLVVYGGQRLVEANAAWHGYDLSHNPGRCGLAAISPAQLGKLAWVRTGGAWIGPCTVVDAVARSDAYGSIYLRHEIAEVSRDVAARLGFAYGAPGFIWFGACPPPPADLPAAEPYAPPLAWDHAPFEATPSFWPYPAQQLPVDCSRPATFR